MENEITVPTILYEGTLSDSSAILRELKSGACKITNVVERLESVLTNPDNDIRVKGVQILSNLLQLSPRTLFTSEELVHISSYYLLRLNDHHSLFSAVLDGILGLTNMLNLPASSAKEFLRGMFNNVQCQQQTQEDRLTFYSIIWILLKCRPEDVKDMEYEFVLGFMDSIQGERDPKCLVVIFKMFVNMKNVISEQHFTEELFEVFAAYFPIDFSAQVDANMPYTRQNLSNLLKVCLTVSSNFAQYTIPLLIEKLDSDLETAKLDSLDLLDYSTKTFSSKQYVPFFNAIFLALQQDAMGSASRSVRTKSLVVLHNLTNNLGDKKKEFVDIALNASFPFLCDAETSSYQRSLNVLLVMARTDTEHCSYIGNKILPRLLQLPITHAMLLSIKCILLSFNEFKGHLADETKEGITNILLAGFENTDEKINSEALAILSLVSGYCDFTVNISLYNAVLCPLRRTSSFTIQNNWVSYIGVLAKTMPNKIRYEILPMIFPKDTMNKEEIEQNVNILCQLSFADSFMNECIELMLSMAIDPNSAISSITLQTFSKNIGNGATQHNWNIWMDMLTNKFKLQNHLITWIENENTLFTEDILRIIVKILSHISMYLSHHQLQIFLDVQSYSDWREPHLAVAFSKVLRLQRSIPIPRLAQLVAATINCSLTWPCEKVDRAHQMLFTLINKAPEDEIFETILDSIDTQVKSLYNCEVNRTKAIRLSAWVGKALLLRGHKRSGEWIKEMMLATLNFNINCLSNAISIICCDFVLHDGNTRYLYKQHLLSIVQSLHLLQQTQPQRLLVMNRVFKLVPLAVMNMNAETVVHNLKQSMISDDDLMIKLMMDVMIRIFLMPAGSAMELLTNDMETFIPKLLRFAKKTTIGARSCIASLIVGMYADKGPLHKRVRLQSQVLMELRPLLNNPRRYERVMAYVAIDRWSVIGSDDE